MGYGKQLMSGLPTPMAGQMLAETRSMVGGVNKLRIKLTVFLSNQHHMRLEETATTDDTA